MLRNIFDTHAHYDDEQFNEDREELLQSLPAKGVARILNAAADMASSRLGVEMGKQWDFLYSSAGVHPQAAEEVNPQALRELATIAEKPKVVAIGEIGLDYYYQPVDKELQLRAFEAQLALAKELDMPVIIHSRDAQEDTLRLLKRYRPAGIVHCFSGSLEMAKEVLKLDMYLGFTGVLTFKNARRAVEVVDYAPADRLLLETDCPYMAPEPNRGRRCDSSMLPYTAARMAEIKGLEPQAMVDVTHQNALTVYRL